MPAAGQPNVVLLTLTPGQYGLLCFIPDPDRVRHDYGFALSAPLRAGHQVIAVPNEGTQSHMLVFLRLEPGKTPADYVRWAERRDGPPPARTFGGTTGMAPGVLNTIEMDLQPGEYGLMCFGADVADGKPHVAHGMMQQIRVSS